MERSPIVEAQLTFQEEETKLWRGIEPYQISSIASQDPITGIIQPRNTIFDRLEVRIRSIKLEIVKPRKAFIEIYKQWD